MKKEDYDGEILRQLGDRETYKPLKGDPVDNIKIKLNAYLEKYIKKDVITKMEGEYLFRGLDPLHRIYPNL